MAKHERFYINVSNGCNLKCSHCFNNGGVIEGPLLPTPKIMQMVDQAVDSLGITEIQLTGGEPTQRYDIVPMIQGLHDRDLVVLLQTNGCFDQETAGIISRLADDTLGLIISLDGIETNDYFRGRGVTSKVIENIETLSNDISIRINTLLSSRITWGEIEELANLAECFSLSLAFNPVCPSGRAESALLMEPRQYFAWMYRLEGLRSRGIPVRKCFDMVDGHLVECMNCPVRNNAAIHIAADGTAYPCGFLVNKPECQMGSWGERSLLELIDRIPADCRALHPDCQRCRYLLGGRCWGGCPARILNVSGRFGEKDIYCMANCLPSDGVSQNDP